MIDAWRLVDTGLASAAANVALNRALLESRAADEIPSTLRFLRYVPSVLIGCSASPAQELRVGSCRERFVIQRRVTGGTTWMMDERQLGWELYLHRRDVGAVTLQALAKRAGHAAATGLSALGAEARHRAKDGIEIGGRTVCALACAAEGAGVLVQAALLIEADYDALARVLRMPCEDSEAARAALSARTTGLAQALGRRPDLQLVRRYLTEAFESEFGVELREADLTLSEDARYARALAEVRTGGWLELSNAPPSDMPLLHAARDVRGGRLYADLKYERPTRTIREVWFSGDAGLNPQRTLRDLEIALRDCEMGRLAREVERFFASHACAMNAEPRDFVAVVRLAIGEPLAA